MKEISQNLAFEPNFLNFSQVMCVYLFLNKFNFFW